MKTLETTTVYPLWVENDEDFPDPATVYDSYELSGYDPNGADLFVASYSERLAYALELQHRAGQRNDRFGDGMKVEAENLLKNLEHEAKLAREELKERLDLLSEQDKLYAQAVQDWTMTELERRVEARGYDYDQSDERTYLETMDVLDNLVYELAKDEEDDKLIELASTWRSEVAAELTVHNIRDAYRLAA
ncbi:MAG TPA: hypothetical protein PKD28_02990 [Candidatus Saccharibacteria bacterium]|nr:hypothetical protein [Candidatus Saccharibacteria bacterium]